MGDGKWLSCGQKAKLRNQLRSLDPMPTVVSLTPQQEVTEVSKQGLNKYFGHWGWKSCFYETEPLTVYF